MDELRRPVETATQAYLPLQNGIPAGDMNSVTYAEYPPREELAGVVAVFWELKTARQLQKDFTYTVMPDACIDIVFDVATPKTWPLLMTPHVNIEKLNLGTFFHYTGVRFKPGVFTRQAPNVGRIVGKQLAIKTFEDIDLQEVSLALAQAASAEKRLTLLNSFCTLLQSRGYLAQNPMMDFVVAGLYAGKSVEHIALSSGYSSRQLRRLTKQQTGYTPMQLYRVLRFQAALSNDDTRLRFADESHLIKEFRRITGRPYRQFVQQFK